MIDCKHSSLMAETKIMNKETKMSAENPKPDEQAQLKAESTEATKKTIESSKPPKTQEEIADQVGRITYKLAGRIEKLSPDKRWTDWGSRKTERLADGGKLEVRHGDAVKGVAYSDAEGDEHKAAAVWPSPLDNDEFREVSTRSLTNEGGSSMSTVEDDPKRGINKRMNISGDPRSFEESFDPPTEEIRRQAISNAAETLGTIRGAVVRAENEQQSEQSQPGPEEPQPPIQNAA